MADAKTVDAGLLQSRYRLTKQRATVLRALGDGAHLTAEEIFGRVRAEMPGISLGTVYRTLDILREIGLVQAFVMGTAAARFEAALEKHHHLVCSGCNQLSNVQAERLGSIAHEIAAKMNYDDVDYALTIVGRCEACRAVASDAALHS